MNADWPHRYEGHGKPVKAQHSYVAVLIILMLALIGWSHVLGSVHAQSTGSHRIHLGAQGCDGEHDALNFPNGNYIAFYPYAPPNRFDHLVIHYANGTIWGKPSYGSPDCPDSARCRRATFRINSTWQNCVASSRLFEIVALDEQPIFKSRLLQVIDPATKATVTLSMAVAQAADIPVTAYFAIGLAQLELASGDIDAAEHYLEHAVHLTPNVSGVHLALGIAYGQEGHFEKAIKEFNEAIRLQPNNFWAYVDLADALGRSKHSQEEITAAQQAIRLNPKVAVAYYLLGTAEGATGRVEEASHAYKKAVELKPDYFEAYAGLAFVSIFLGRTVDAWHALQKVDLTKARSSNYAAYMALASCYQAFGLWQLTETSANAAVTLKPDCVECYWYLGNSYYSLGRIDDARKAYQKALAIKPNYSAAEAGLALLAEASGDLDGAQKFFDAAYRSLADTTDERVRTTTEATILTERANIQRDLGNYGQSFEFYNQAVEKSRSIGDHKKAGATLVKIAEVYRQIGDIKTSAQWYTYALQESERARDLDGQFTALARLGILAWSMGDRAGSIRYGHQVMELWGNTSKDKNSKALMPVLFFGETGAMLGEMLADNGQPAQAIPFLQARIAGYSLGAQGETSLREIAVSSLFLADAYMRAGKYDEALNAAKRAEAIAEKYKSPEIVWAYLRIGEIREKQGDLDESLQYYERAAKVLERLGAEQQLPELQLSSREQTWGVYENLTRVSLKLYAKSPSADRLSRIFVYHEKGKTRGLLDLLDEAGVRAREGVDPTLVHKEERLRAKVSALRSLFSDETISDLRKTSLQQALKNQEAALREVHEEIAAANPKYDSLSSPKVARITDIQALLGNDAVLLEYDLGPDFSGVGVLTDRAIQVYRLPSQDVIDKALKEFLPTLRAPLFGTAEIDEHVRLAKDLYLTLLGPTRDLIRGKRHIVVVPDGDLYYLPFEALIATDEKVERPNVSLASQPYLAKAYSFSYAPSASVLVTIERNARNHRAGRAANQRPLLAFADPTPAYSPATSQVALSTRGAYEKMGVSFNRLPYSREEVRRVASVYGIGPDSSSINLGDKATKKRLEQLDLTQFRILHFATHAIVGDEVKWISQPALVLSPEGTGKGDDGLLKMSDIFNLHLNADLVVLSACETARGEMSRGEGIVGLTSAFLFAGSDSVVASLWNVNDESTSLFMEHFYVALKQGLTKAEALRKARREVMQMRIRDNATGQEESLASPYFWAPFILVGSWR